jgi:hypothetical protein
VVASHIGLNWGDVSVCGVGAIRFVTSFQQLHVRKRLSYEPTQLVRFFKMAAITIAAPLASYEKKLLDNFRTFLGNTSANQLSQERRDYAFSRWHWTRYTQEIFQETFQLDFRLHNGDWLKAWDCFIHTFHNRADGSSFSRIEMLQLNHSPERWDYTIPILNNIKVIPNENDSQYWQLVAELLAFYEEAEPTYSDPLASQRSLIQDNEPENTTVKALVTSLIAASLEGRQAPEFSEAQLEVAYAQSWDFDIWSLVRSCALLHRRSDSGLSATEGLRMAGFYDRHDAVRNGFIVKPLGNPLSTSLRPVRQTSRRLWSARTPLSLKLGSFGVDPLKYVEHIPWADLHPCSPRHLLEEFRGHRFMNWDPQKPMKFERFLYTEEDVFQFCVDFNVTLPDYLFQDRVLFILSPIAEFTFESLANDYWRHWVCTTATRTLVLI